MPLSAEKGWSETTGRVVRYYQLRSHARCVVSKATASICNAITLQEEEKKHSCSTSVSTQNATRKYTWNHDGQKKTDYSGVVEIPKPLLTQTLMPW